MHSSRFVTLCFVYCGVLLLAMQVLIYGPGLTVAFIANAGVALCILFTGVYRLYSEEEERKPEEYGLFSYVMASFSVLITLLFLAVLYIF